MSAPELLDEVILLNDEADRNGQDRGLLLTRPLVEELWAAARQLMDGGKREGHPGHRVPCPVVDETPELEGPEFLLGSSLLLRAERAPRRRPSDARKAWWVEENPGAWILCALEPGDGLHAYSIWDVLAASMVLGPLEAMRAQLRELSTHARFTDAMLLPIEAPAAFSDVLVDPDRWTQLLGKEELAILLTSEVRQIRESAIHSLGTLRAPIGRRPAPPHAGYAHLAPTRPTGSLRGLLDPAAP